MQRIRIGDYITEIVDKTTENNQYPVLTSSQEGIVSQDEYFNKQIASKDNTGYKIIRKNQFTYRAMSDTGRFYINQLLRYDIGIVSPAYPVFEVKDSGVLYAPFLNLFFRSEYFQALISTQSTGSTRVSLKLDKIKKIEFSVPTYKEQVEIVSKVKRLNKIINNRKQQLSKHDDLVKSQFIEMFGSEQKEDSLINLCHFIDYRGKTPEKTESGLPFITARNVKMHYMSFDTQEFISKETYDKVMTRGFPKEGDVVFTTEAPLGNVCRIPHLDTEFYIGQRIITMQTSVLEPAYLEYALSSDTFKKKLAQKSSGSTVTGIRSKLLEQLTIPVPSIDKQKQFAMFIEQTDKSKDVTELEVAA